jgi:diacylglycerol kinase (ATP)
MKASNTGFKRIWYATKFSFKGLDFAFRNESAIRQEFAALCVLIPLAFYLGDNKIEWILMIASCLLVIIVELLNSAIEAVVDRVGEEFHPLSGAAKDMGSASVMLSIALFILVWGLILLF